MHPLADVHLIAGRGSNLYLCTDDQGLALIDAGFPGDQWRVLARLEQLGYQPQQLTRILITHADIDHVGSLAALQEVSGATVYAGAETAVFLRSGRSPAHMPRPVQAVLDAFVRARTVPPQMITTFEDGDVLPVLGGLRALATPGHTLDHFSFYAPARGILFAGDALNTRDGRLQRTPPRITADGEAANSSAIRLLQLAPAVIACGHGPPSDDHDMDDLMALFNQLRRPANAG